MAYSSTNRRALPRAKVALDGSGFLTSPRVKPRGLELSVIIVGRGKVGSALHQALRDVGADVSSIGGRSLIGDAPAGRAALRKAVRRIERSRSTKQCICILAVRDADIPKVATRVAEVMTFPIPLVHTAGGLGPEALAPAAALGIPTAQMHPLLSFISKRAPALTGATLLIEGHPRAAKAARLVARALGFVPRSYPTLPRPVYHAAAALLANGTAALAEASVSLLTSASVERVDAVAMMGPLLRSVVENLLEVGLPEALSGPVRRGDRHAIEAHWEAIRGASPAIRALYVSLVSVQIGMAEKLGEAPPGDLKRLGSWVGQRHGDLASEPSPDRRPRKSKSRFLKPRLRPRKALHS